MRAIALVVAALLVASVAAGTNPQRFSSKKEKKVADPAAPTPSPSPWKIVEAWKKKLPNQGMQIYPVYGNVPGVYVSTDSNGTVWALNTTSREFLWHRNWQNLAFIQSIYHLNAIIVGLTDSTYALDVITGKVLWSNTSIQMYPDLNQGVNMLVFDSLVVYREQSLGYTRLCGLQVMSGVRVWCAPHRTLAVPDPSYNGTLTAPFFDEAGNSYVAGLRAVDGSITWIQQVSSVLTGSYRYVGVTNGTQIFLLDAMSGNTVSSTDLGYGFSGTAVFVNDHILAVCDGKTYVAAIDARSGAGVWNVSAGTPNTQLMQLQHRGETVLVLASLSKDSTNFTRYDAWTGAATWTLMARPTGMSIAPVHAWLGNDILYLRDVDNSWSAWGADSGELISKGPGDLFLPRSVAMSWNRPHFEYYVTSIEGYIIKLAIDRKEW